ncbi:hypothetical protein A2W13_03330 [Candidatus Woesebacteria bacterium RBG_16_36_11]|uniref:DUF5666 domain-containing protein n=3 Tax=Candidatus Woeseibacteriota TaxID=1752722 RepID=A0A1F7XCI5_9BACT|nr:MAG: hypothetical protein A2Z67_00410 [Candidatus Woesebacteria bacterium RBG_13_36_22]OGM12489.1 MAG: hypothetical protein A2W13_03330 [Candidatus Woesebacteria bacterium RBG_16_36_11]OGM17370.1 MAG: hypothetical protein A2V55_00185 [Candidatus Woesebacteria bacterium RBG_19FT_COMBO_37_29]
MNLQNKFMKKIAVIILSIILFSSSLKFLKAQTATSSSESIREKVQEKVTQVLSNPKAYIGTITDISSTTIQVRKFLLDSEGKTGEILQISTNQDTVFVSVGKTTKIIKMADVAIGDFIIAMGYKNGNNVLNSTRILVTEALKPSNRIAVFGKVTKANKSSLEITSLANEKLTLEPNTSISVVDFTDQKETKIKFADIEADDFLIAFGIMNNNVFEARKIERISLTPSASPISTSSPSPKPTATPKTTPSPTP